MQQYLNVLQKILNEGVEKQSGRENMPNTIGVSHAEIEMDMRDGFPLLTTKKMYWKGIVHELLWFLKGDTNIKYLIDNNVHIWDQDSYRWYIKYASDNGGVEQSAIMHNNGDGTERMFLMEEFIQNIKDGNIGTYKGYKLGDLGKVYGYQWRNQNGVDQVKECIDGLKSNPYSRYHIIDAWDKASFKEMALPPYHLLYQFIVRPMDLMERNELASKLDFRPHEVGHNAFDEFGVPKFYLDLNMYQRSVDSFLGCPFNIASMSLLLMIFARACNMIPGTAVWMGGDTHLYINHIDAAKGQLTRKPYNLPQMKINKELNGLDDILALTIDDFELIGYESHPAIKAELFTGLKK